MQNNNRQSVQNSVYANTGYLANNVYSILQVCWEISWEYDIPEIVKTSAPRSDVKPNYEMPMTWHPERCVSDSQEDIYKLSESVSEGSATDATHLKKTIYLASSYRVFIKYCVFL